VFVGICRLTLHLRGNSSLKGKRAILRKVIDRTRAKFNAAVAEVGDNDARQRAVIGAAVVGNSAAHVDSMLAKIGSFVERVGVAPLAGWETEVIPLGDSIGGADPYGELRATAPWEADAEDDEAWEDR
jgi:uncharacterized protein YlxP (DUF503 family)